MKLPSPVSNSIPNSRLRTIKSLNELIQYVGWLEQRVTTVERLCLTGSIIYKDSDYKAYIEAEMSRIHAQELRNRVPPIKP